MNAISSYPYLVSAIGSLAFIMLVQVLIADIVGIRDKHLPGSTVRADHGNLLFRSSRVVANTNESIAIFILASVFCIASHASPMVAGIAAWVFVVARLFYAFCYYRNLQIIRSVMFGISLLTLAVLLMTGVYGWI